MPTRPSAPRRLRDWVSPGTREIAALLAKIAAGTDATETKAAKASLARLNGPDVNAAGLGRRRRR